MMSTYSRSDIRDDSYIARGPTLVKWGPVFAGAVSAFAMFVLFAAFWLAIAYSNIGGGGESDLDVNVTGIANNLGWYLAGSAIVAIFIGGFISGWFSGLRGAGAGAFDGLLAWGVTVFGTLVLGTPSVLGALGVGSGDRQFGFGNLWETFFGIAIGLVAAVCGGAIGGAARRPSWLFRPQSMEVTELVSEAPGIVRVQGRQLVLRPAHDGAERVAASTLV